VSATGTAASDISLREAAQHAVKDVETDRVSPGVVVVQNWLDELKRLVPTN
jgi:hypothetical protein